MRTTRHGRRVARWMVVAMVAVGAPVGYATATGASAPPPDPQFSSPEDVGGAPTTETEALAVGDFTGDGRNDVVISTTGFQGRATDDKLVLLAQAADGNLEKASSLDTDLGSADRGHAGLAAADFDGDGLTDVALTTQSGIDLFLQRAGALGPRALVAAPAGYQVRAADMDDDRVADLVVNGSSGIAWLRGRGDGTFGLPTAVAGPKWYADMAVGDANGDGLTDVVASAQLESKVHVFSHLADGTFADSTSAGGASGLAIADLTGDAKDDVVWTNGGNRPMSSVVVLAQRAGRLAPGVVYPSYDIPAPVVTADVNGDGRTDVVTLHSGWAQAGVYPQTADGRLGPERLFAITAGGYDLPSFRPDQLAVGDVNGDGLPDMVMHGGAAYLRVLRGRPPAAPPTTTVPPVTPTTTTVPTTPPPPSLDETSAFQIDAAHSGVARGSSLAPPLSKRWSRSLDGTVHHPLAARGLVFALATRPGGVDTLTTLYALDPATGRDAWGPIDLGSGAEFTYGDGQVFVVNVDGIVRSFDAVTGRQRWISQIVYRPTLNFRSPPAYSGGVLYVDGTDNGGGLFALSGTDGGVLWSTPVVNGDSGPAAAGGRVFISQNCAPGAAWRQSGGLPVWGVSYACSGGGSRGVPVVADGLVWSRDARPLMTAFDAGTGAAVTTFAASAPPVIDGDRGYFLDGGVLEERQPLSQDVGWSFAGDGQLVSAPVLANGFVYEASTSGRLWAVDAATGRLAWDGDAGAPILPPEGYYSKGASAGIAIGQGLLVVPASTELVAFGGAAAQPATRLAAGPVPAKTATQSSPTSGAASDESPGYRVDAAHQNLQSSGFEQAAFTRRWARDLGAPTDHALLVGGKVIVAAGTTLHALDPVTGDDLWDPVVLGPDRSPTAAAAFGDGRIYASGGGGSLQAIDPATGRRLWVADSPTLGFGGPTYSQGIVYQDGAAYSATTGRQLWRHYAVQGAPAVVGDVVYSTGYCIEARAFRATTGDALWPDPEWCRDSGTTVPVLANGQLWIGMRKTPRLLDPVDGKLVGASSGGPPAFDRTRAYARDGSVVKARDASTQFRRWTFVGDGQVATEPTVSGNQVLVASAKGTVWALDSETGTPLWSDDAGSPVPNGATIGVGQGVMILPTTTGVVAYGPATAPPASRPRPALGFGWNGMGALGTGSRADSRRPVTVNGLTGVVAVAAGGIHSLALRSDGTVWAWGWNAYGQLGDGTTTDRTAPVPVAGLTEVVAISAGGYHSLAVKKDGSVWAWGYNGAGAVGDGTRMTRLTPVRVPGLAAMTSVSAGLLHSLALGTDGRVRSWGWNGVGQLGDRTTTDRLLPVPVTGAADVASVSAGGYHSLAAKRDGTVSAWGWNASGQLGDGTTATRVVPVPVKGLANVVRISAGIAHSVAVVDDGTVRAWGWNAVGQLGDGTLTDRRTPVVVPGLRGVTDASAAYQTVVRREDGTIAAWGWNAYGQVGDGTSTNRATPTIIGPVRGVTSVGAGMFHSLATGSLPDR